MNRNDIDLGVFVRLYDKVDAPLKRLESKMDRASKRMKKAMALSAKLTGIGAVSAGVAYASKRIIENILEPVRAVEKAKGELASLGVEQIKIVTDMGKEMEKKWAGVTAASFVTAAYDIRSGISSLSDQGVADMTRAAVLVAKATKGVPEEMTSLFATGYGIFKQQYQQMDDAQFGTLFGDMISKSTQQFKTDGAAMQAAVESAGATATLLGQDMSAQLAIMGQLQSVMSGSESGTALKAYALNSAKANAEFKKMGINIRTLDDKGMLRSMPDVLADMKAQLGDFNGENVEILKKAFGSEEAVKVLSTLWGQEEALRANSAALEDAAASGGKFTENMAKAVDNNFDARAQKMAQKWNVMKITLGEKMIPVLEKVIPVLSNAFDAMAKFADENPKLAASFAIVIVAIGGVAAILAPLMFVGAQSILMFRGLGGAIAILKTGKITKAGSELFGLGKKAIGAGKKMLIAGKNYTVMAGKFVAGKTKAAGTALFGLGKKAIGAGLSFLKAGFMMMMSPIGLVVLAVSALAAGVYLIYKNWDTIGPWFANMWAKVKTVFSNGWSNVKSLASSWGANMRSIGGNIVRGLAVGISSAPKAVWNALKGVVLGGVGKVKGWLGIKSPSRVFMGIGGDVTDGLAVGIGAGEKGVIGRMQRMAKTITRPMKSSVKLATQIAAPALLAQASVAAPILPQKSLANETLQNTAERPGASPYENQYYQQDSQREFSNFGNLPNQITHEGDGHKHISYAPHYNINVQLSDAANAQDIEKLKQVIRQMLREHDEEAAVSVRRLLHD